MIERNDKEELMRLIKEYPNLPLVFIASNDEFAPEYGSSVFSNYYCDKCTIWIDEEGLVYDDTREIIEVYEYKLDGIGEYENLSGEDFEKAVKEYVEQEIEHYDAIVVTMTP